MARGYSDTCARFKVWSIHPFIYQDFLFKPIHLPIFLSIFALGLIYLPKFEAQIHPPTIFLPIFALKPIYLPKADIQTHPSTKILQIFWKMTHPSIYISLSKAIHLHRAYVSMKICWYPPPGEGWNLFSKF